MLIGAVGSLVALLAALLAAEAMLRLPLALAWQLLAWQLLACELWRLRLAGESSEARLQPPHRR